MATQTKTKKLKAKDPISWTDRNHNVRRGQVVTFIPSNVSFMSKLTKKLQSLPAKNRKIEDVVSFDRYIVMEEHGDQTSLFSLRASAIAV